MKVQDLRVYPENHLLQADLCIVGSGPAGLTIAGEFAESAFDVLVVESGGLATDSFFDGLNEIENVGNRRVLDQSLVRNRVFGGSSHTWSGRIAPFGESDFELRDWVAGSGWPFDRSDMRQYLQRSAGYLGIAAEADSQEVRDVASPLLGRLDGRYLTNYSWLYSQDSLGSKDFQRFGRTALANPASNVRVLLQSSVTHLDTTADGRAVTGLEVVGRDGIKRRVEARIVVLCAGGIENARLLLASNRILRTGVGNQNDVVGRYLADHPRGAVGHYSKSDHYAAQELFGNYYLSLSGAKVTVTPGVELSRQVQRSESLLNCALWLSGSPAEDDAISLVSSGARGQLGDIAKFAKQFRSNAILLGRGAQRVLRDGRAPLRRYARLELQAIVEQEPDRESRVSLSQKTDAFGVPLARVDWRVGEKEGITVRRATELFVSEMKRLGAPAPVLEEFIGDPRAELGFPDVAHPSGTTRMSENPRYGVVNSKLAVHGVERLFICGGSVFPTNGHANPTQMIVALAIRLADELKVRLKNGEGSAKVSSVSGGSATLQADRTVKASRASGTSNAKEDKPVALVTGATGKLGTAVLPLLTEAGFTVRALTSRVGARDGDLIDWRVRDLRRFDLDFKDEMRGVNVVVHLGAELGNEDDMYRTNVEATAALARAAENEGVTAFCFTSSVSVYGSATGRQSREDSTLLTTSHDNRREYLGNSALRAYGRSKALAEAELRRTADRTAYVIFRPSVVVDDKDLGEVLCWGRLRRMLLSHRNTNHVYIDDVAAAIRWAVLEARIGVPVRPGSVSTYNLSDAESGTFSEFFASARSAGVIETNDRPFELPRIFDWAKEILRFRSSAPWRRPLGMMTFPNSALSASGFELPIGMRRARLQAFREHALLDSV